MTYRHLLSRRNALLRGAAIVAVALGTACADGPTDPQSTELLASRSGSPRSSHSALELVATPEHPVIAPADTTVLVATAVKSDGSRRTLNAQWVALDGGKLSRHNNRGRHAMKFTARSTGAYRLVAKASSLNQSDTTVVTVVVPPPTIAIERVVLSPANVVLLPGDTLQFSAHAETATGDSLPADVSVSATGGTLDGLAYSASVPGTYKVIAELTGTSLVDTAFVTVQPAVAPTAPTQPADSGAAPSVDSAVTTPIPPSNVTSPTSPSSPAELPRVYVNTTMPARTGRTIVVPAGGNLQTAVNTAARGDVIELTAGATYSGNFILPAKSGTGWVTIRTATTLPPEGTRVTPATAAQFARIRTPNSMAAIRTAAGANASYYRLTGLDIGSTASMTYALVFLGDVGATSVDQLPTDIVLDRVYVHGTATQQIQRCVALNSRRSAVIDSWLAECHMKGFDSQAIIGWAGPGPYKIVNNHLEGAGENVMFGGADPKIVGVVPSDIEIRRNHFLKPLAWKTSNLWTVKNLYESKSSQRVLIEGNIFENNWPNAQTGMAIVLKSQNDGGRCTWCVTRDYTMRYNKVINSPGGFVIAATQTTSGGASSIPASRITISHTLFDAVAVSGMPGATRLFQIGGGLRDLYIEHNTAFPTAMMIFLTGAKGSSTHMVLRNNVFARGTTGLFGDGMMEGSSSVATYAPTSTVTGNVLIGSKAATYPAGNWLVPSNTGVGFVSYGTKDFRLTSTSPYYDKGTDGTSPGVDLNTLNSKTAGVR